MLASINGPHCEKTLSSGFLTRLNTNQARERTGLVVRASDSGSGDPGSILGQVGVLFP